MLKKSQVCVPEVSSKISNEAAKLEDSPSQNSILLQKQASIKATRQLHLKRKSKRQMSNYHSGYLEKIDKLIILGVISLLFSEVILHSDSNSIAFSLCALAASIVLITTCFFIVCPKTHIAAKLCEQTLSIAEKFIDRVKNR
ncbi:hypothetical protein [Dictyobacter aurantiacus]|uniref:Uncharacterized protein n=1 Tax=Dictyobacter aurantiacus TaxID=1936993 RepID=A0A401ZR48_9CHLR|nr:hypothetical protein [Dictyobacter aurantiacus]GCE09302.1 hypothetical protein KDAU_66310 [Dictyobacter aurantiacus]